MIIFVADMFASQYEGGAELTTEAIISDGLFPCVRINSQTPELRKTMEQYKDSFWIFGNYASVPEECLLYAAKNLNYSVLEYDYKYCGFRSPGKHIALQNNCNCSKTNRGKLVSIFLYSSKILWWMSRAQMNRHHSVFPFLKNANNKVLSSVFSDETLKYIKSLDTNKKENKYLILNSSSWIKGADDAVDYAKKNNLNYELVWGIDHKDLLAKLAKSKGIIFFPRAGDTCPRMTIEAKLLGCELILNTNVQHKDEEWFSNKDLILNYLKERTSTFWNEIEKVAQEHLNLPKNTTRDNSVKFNIIVPFYNCEKWIKKCIKSTKRQQYKNFNCVLIDDMSTDNSVNIVKNEILNDNRFKLIKNKTKKYALRNIVEAIDGLECADDDVSILLDGDDWFASSNSLSQLCDAYKDDTLMTYGSYVYNPGGTKGVEPSKYPEDVIKTNSFRKDQWRASHLRTFKYKLWKNLDKNDLKDDDKYYEMTYDQAIMLPLLEMASERSKYIPEVLHTYNKENPLNVDKIKAQEQSELAQKIRNKKPYTRI
tara:strand:+ start:1180 stop:2796 length:1617 start_codon:yes stop_codon:yes gene_type:complete